MDGYKTIQIPEGAKCVRDSDTYKSDSSVYFVDDKVYKEYEYINPKDIELYHYIQSLCATQSRDIKAPEPFELQGSTIHKVTVNFLPLDPTQIYKNGKRGCITIIDRVYGENLGTIIEKIQTKHLEKIRTEGLYTEKHMDDNYGHTMRCIKWIGSYVEEYVQKICEDILTQVRGVPNKLPDSRKAKSSTANMMAKIDNNTLHITVTDIASNMYDFLRYFQFEREETIEYIKTNTKDIIEILIQTASKNKDECSTPSKNLPKTL